MELFLATPRGFCAGVVRAIEIVEKALNMYGAPIYVKHEIVHNNYVVDDLTTKGAITLKDINEAPNGSTVIFSAHAAFRQACKNVGLGPRVNPHILQRGRAD